MFENTTPSTELPRDFCAGIGPLQLGVVLVHYFFNTLNENAQIKKIAKQDTQNRLTFGCFCIIRYGF